MRHVDLFAPLLRDTSFVVIASANWRLRSRLQGLKLSTSDHLLSVGPGSASHPKLHAPDGTPSKPGPERPFSPTAALTPTRGIAGRPDQSSTRRERRLLLNPRHVPERCPLRQPRAQAAVSFCARVAAQVFTFDSQLTSVITPRGTSPVVK
jgi:hypothetical protein